MLVCGIDEAGRGPVLGPLVVCGVLVKEENIEKLKELGVKDSKLLAREQREELFEKIKKMCVSHKLIIVNSEEIDQRYSNLSNLNKLEGKKIIEIINCLNPGKAFIDCPDVNQVRFKHELETSIKKEVELVVEHKADYNYPVVGAASILAKVTRDRIIEDLKQYHKVEFGSGYMSDELTQQFLREHWNNPEFSYLFRKSWQSWKDLQEQKQQRKLGDY